MAVPPVRAHNDLGHVADHNAIRQSILDITGFSVSDYGAIGDGLTDDTLAIQAALDAVPNSGGKVYLPPGEYKVSSTLRFKGKTVLMGAHTPGYLPVQDPASGCKIKASATFSGSCLITGYANALGVSVSNVCLVGPGESYGSVVHGVSFPSPATAELGWLFRDVTIAGFSGDGFSGDAWVVDLNGVHVTRCRWAISADSGGAWRDCRIAQCQFYFNKDGGIRFTGNKYSGAVTIVGTRVERSGNTYGFPLSPRNTNAPGIYITTGFEIQLIGVSTDANTGSGLLIERASPSFRLDSISVLGCQFARDGGGDQVTLGEHAGIKVVGLSPAGTGGADYIKIVACDITYGKHDDSGGGTLLVPKHGIHLENTLFSQAIGCRVDTATGSNYNIVGGDVYQPIIIDSREAIATMPSSGTPAPGKFQGQMIYDLTNLEPRWWSGSDWRDAGFPEGGGTFTSDFGRSGPAATTRSFKLQTAGVDRWYVAATSTAEAGSNSGTDFAISRWSDTGVYIDNALEILRNTGVVVIPNGLFVNNTVDVNGHGIINVPTPTGPTDAATKAYVDTQVQYFTGFVQTTLSSAGAVTITPGSANARYQRVILNAACTGLTVSAGAYTGQEFVLELQPNGNTPAAYTGIKFAGATAPTWSVGSQSDYLTFIWNGSEWHEKSRSIGVA